MDRPRRRPSGRARSRHKGVSPDPTEGFEVARLSMKRWHRVETGKAATLSSNGYGPDRRPVRRTAAPEAARPAPDLSGGFHRDSRQLTPWTERLRDGRRQPLRPDRQRELFTAAKAQLWKRYTIHSRADAQGIYLVLWFGPDVTVAGKRNTGSPPLQAFGMRLWPTSRRSLQAVSTSLSSTSPGDHGRHGTASHPIPSPRNAATRSNPPAPALRASACR